MTAIEFSLSPCLLPLLITDDRAARACETAMLQTSRRSVTATQPQIRGVQPERPRFGTERYECYRTALTLEALRYARDGYLDKLQLQLADPVAYGWR